MDKYYRVIQDLPELNRGAILKGKSNWLDGSARVTRYKAVSGMNKLTGQNGSVEYVAKVVEEQPQWFEEVEMTFKPKWEKEDE